MKKIYFLSALLTSMLLNAQTRTISFESSEGFTNGSIHGQNSWTTTGAGVGVNITGQLVNNTRATQGTNSLKVAYEPNYNGLSSLIMGAFYDLPTAINDNRYEISFDVFPEYTEDDGSDFRFASLSTPDAEGSAFYTSMIQLSYTGSVRYFNFANAETPQFTNVGTWTANQWNHFKIAVNKTAQNIKYYVNNVEVFSGTLYLTADFKSLSLTHDNYGGNFFIDNIVINGANTLNTEVFNASSVNVYPNPATNIVNLEFATGNINSVKIFDLNGRVVKNQVFSNLQNATVNIQDLSVGTYMLEIGTDKGFITKKIVKN